jgi:ribosomal protein L9
MTAFARDDVKTKQVRHAFHNENRSHISVKTRTILQGVQEQGFEIRRRYSDSFDLTIRLTLF